jgi:hypothetical protein
MRLPAALVLAIGVSAAQGQTIEQRAADVRRTLAPPPPVETVIERGNAPLTPSATPTPAPALVVPTASVPARQPEALQAVGESADRTNTIFGSPGSVNDPRGTVFVDDPRGTAIMGVPPGMSSNRMPGYVPGIVTYPTRGQPVRGARNLSTGQRSFSAGDSNP